MNNRECKDGNIGTEVVQFPFRYLWIWGKAATDGVCLLLLFLPAFMLQWSEGECLPGARPARARRAPGALLLY